MQLDWEIWLDNHISPVVAKWIQEEFNWVAKSSYALELASLDDTEIFQKAKEAGKIILLTKDIDFKELIRRLGAPPKVINLRIGNCDNHDLWIWLKDKLYQGIELLTTLDIDYLELE